MKILLYVGFLLVIVITSCSDHYVVRREFSILTSKPIILPNEAIITVKGEDSVINDFFECDYKMVVYSDSVECSSCNINKMHQWEPLIEYAKNYNGRLKYYFIFSNNKILDIRKNLKFNTFSYPVLIDAKSDFERLNPHLPKNNAMHTFLLDENNKVILVGNPLQNKEVEKLFYKITQEKLTK